MFRHEPRNRAEKLPDGFTPFVTDNDDARRHLQRPSGSDDELLEALIEEVWRNGFEGDLVTRDGESLLAGNVHDVALWRITCCVVALIQTHYKILRHS